MATILSAMLELTDETAPHQIPFEAYGIELRVCTNSPEVLTRITPLMPPGWRACEPTEDQHRLGIIVEDDGTSSVFNGPARVSEGQGIELSLMVLDGQLRGYVALNALGKTFIHAGAIAHEGRAIIFPGHSFSGKTTLVAALVRAGAVYYSDEFAVLDADGLVHPYAKPLSLRDDPAIGQAEYPVEQLGGTAGEDPLPLGMAVITSYRPGTQWRPRRLAPGAAALALLSHTVAARSRPDAAMRAITRALDDAVALAGERGEADEIAGELLETLRGHTAASPSIS
jgi:hypothetical protein